MDSFPNPFRPGAGHMPPYLAGRTPEIEEFKKLLKQKIILQNLIITGLRGIGKTVLLEKLKPIAISEGWLWTGGNVSESATVSENSLVMRMLTDISIVTENLTVSSKIVSEFGFGAPSKEDVYLDFNYLVEFYSAQ